MNEFEPYDPEDDEPDPYAPAPVLSPQPHVRQPTQHEAIVAGTSALLGRLPRPSSTQAHANAYREHLDSPPAGPGDVACNCVACRAFADHLKTMSREQAIVTTLERMQRG